MGILVVNILGMYKCEGYGSECAVLLQKRFLLNPSRHRTAYPTTVSCEAFTHNHPGRCFLMRSWKVPCSLLHHPDNIVQQRNKISLSLHLLFPVTVYGLTDKSISEKCWMLSHTQVSTLIYSATPFSAAGLRYLCNLICWNRNRPTTGSYQMTVLMLSTFMPTMYQLVLDDKW